jgi:hypothetical protein
MTPLKLTPGEVKRLERNLQGKKTKNKMETIHAEAFMMLVKVDDISCGEERDIPHVWESSKIPPRNNATCMCGEVTWIEDVERRRKEFSKAKPNDVEGNNDARKLR